MGTFGSNPRFTGGSEAVRIMAFALASCLPAGSQRVAGGSRAYQGRRSAELTTSATQRAPLRAGWPPLPRRGKLGCMSDAAAAVSVPPATAADAADPACDVAHGRAEAPADTRTLVAVFTSP